MKRVIQTGRKGLYGLTLSVASIFACSPAMADSAPHSPDRGDAAYTTKHKSKWPQATLQAQARAEVDHDTVRILLAAEISETSQDAVTQALTSAVKTAMDRALENAGGVKVSSGSYRVWPMNDKDGNISNWRGRGEISLESTDFSAASKLAASLSDLMAVSSVSFSVSPRVRAKEEQRLLAQAAQAFRDRAQTLATALGYSDYSLRSVDLGGSGAQYEVASRGTMAQAAMFKAADSIPLEGGTETVSVSIHGSVFLLAEIKESDQ